MKKLNNTIFSFIYFLISFIIAIRYFNLIEVIIFIVMYLIFYMNKVNKNFLEKIIVFIPITIVIFLLIAKRLILVEAIMFIVIDLIFYINRENKKILEKIIAFIPIILVYNYQSLEKSIKKGSYPVYSAINDENNFEAFVLLILLLIVILMNYKKIKEKIYNMYKKNPSGTVIIVSWLIFYFPIGIFLLSPTLNALIFMYIIFLTDMEQILSGRKSYKFLFLILSIFVLELSRLEYQEANLYKDQLKKIEILRDKFSK